MAPSSRLALIGGTSFLGAEPPAGSAAREVETGRGMVTVHERDGIVVLQRHGFGEYRNAARIDHARNISALAELGCERILAIASVGALRPELAVGSFVCPDDFIALQLGLSLSDGHGGERVPGFDPDLRADLIAAWSRLAEPPLIDGGVYWQAIGPRFETAAEIRMIAAHADVIGMTAASECIVAGELGIPYAVVCVIDNLANGIGTAALSVAEFEAGRERNRRLAVASVKVVAAGLARAENAV